MEKYVLVEWPTTQIFMHHPRWNECIYTLNIDGHPCPDSAVMVPESIFNDETIYN